MGEAPNQRRWNDAVSDLPTFHGSSKDTITAESIVIRVEAAALALAWDDVATYHNFSLSLRSNAEEWLSLQADIRGAAFLKTWVYIKPIFLKAFGAKMDKSKSRGNRGDNSRGHFSGGYYTTSKKCNNANGNNGNNGNQGNNGSGGTNQGQGQNANNGNGNNGNGNNGNQGNNGSGGTSQGQGQNKDSAPKQPQPEKCNFCNTIGHHQERCNKRIAAGKPCVSASGKNYFPKPKVYPVEEEEMDKEMGQPGEYQNAVREERKSEYLFQ